LGAVGTTMLRAFHAGDVGQPAGMSRGVDIDR